MNDDERHDPGSGGDEFWGSTPDWTGRVERVRPRRSESADISGAIKRVWDSALSAGAHATREHRVIDATAPRPDHAADRSGDDALVADLFGEIDDDLGETDLGATTEVPVVDARRRQHVTDAAPASSSRQNGPGRLDPLLVRIGAVAVVTTLLVPLMLGLRSGDTDDTISSADTVAAAVETTPDIVQGDAADVASPPPLDPSELPPAVPARSAGEPGDTASTSNDTAVLSDAATASDSTSSGNGESDGSGTDANDVASSVNEVEDGAMAATESDANKPVCGNDYEVRTGDFWIGLADRADVSLADLLSVNDASVTTPLFPGNEICLPTGAKDPTPTETTPTTPAPATTTPATTTPATTRPTTTTTTTVPAGADASPDEVQQIIRDVWPDELEERALEIAFRESRYVPTAKNFCCYGIFQIYWEVHDVWLDDIGITSAEQLYDPSTNAKAAYALYQRAGGWGPWQL
ncbi:MAG: LysM peptidoglycan-binding domain-containing protein [Ilumatobacter sp.]